MDEEEIRIPNLNEKIHKVFPRKKKSPSAVKILLINISSYFTGDRDATEFDVLEPPLGLISLLSYLNDVYGENINGKIIKSKVDFDSYDQLNNVIDDFDPDLIGIGTMTFHKDFFHKAIKNIREHGYKKMIFCGGPHPTTSYSEVLNDKNIDVVVIGEGELTLTAIIDKYTANKKSRFSYEDLIDIDGIAFSEENFSKSLKKIL